MAGVDEIYLQQYWADNKYAALELTDIDARDNRVARMYYTVGDTDWGEFMPRFVKEIEINRLTGFVRLFVTLDNSQFSWIFRKLDVYLVAVHDGKTLYELGESPYMPGRPNRWVSDAILTRYGEKYSDLLANRRIPGNTLSFENFRAAAHTIIANPGRPDLWRNSFGITGLMFSEPARFVWFQDVLKVKMNDGTSMYLAEQWEEGEQFVWGGYIPNKWSVFTKCARKFVNPGPLRYPPKTLLGACECEVNPTAACKALSLKCYHPSYDGTGDAVGRGREQAGRGRGREQGGRGHEQGGREQAGRGRGRGREQGGRGHEQAGRGRGRGREQGGRGHEQGGRGRRQ